MIQRSTSRVALVLSWFRLQWARLLLAFLRVYALFGGGEPTQGPAPRYTERDMRQLVAAVFGPGARYYESLTWGPGIEGERGLPRTQAVVIARGYHPIAGWWPRGQDRAGRLAFAADLRRPIFRLRHRNLGR